MNNQIQKPLIYTDAELVELLGICTPPLQVIAKKPIRPSKLFIKGPIPFEWLSRANALGGSTGIVATGLWLYVGLNGSKYFKVDSKLDQFAGVTRQTRQHALHKLQGAGLIKLKEHHGAYPFVEVITVVSQLGLHR